MSTLRSKNAGFTLIEMLIIAPLAIILVGGLVAAIVAMTSKVMISQARNDITYSSNEALTQIENDVHLSLNFMTDSGSLDSPQGSDGGTASFTSANALVLETLTTDRNPLDPNKNIVYYNNQPNPCGPTESVNTPLTMKVIYFTSGSDLWRRVDLPHSSTLYPCKTPWQVNTCASGYNYWNGCGAKDELMASNVDSFNVDYYMNPSDASAAPKSSASAAKGIEATINTERKIAGETITASYSVRASLFTSGDQAY